MSEPYKLPWENLEWKQFQRLCILLAEDKFPDVHFEEYLKHGHKQDGVDLWAFRNKNGSFVGVQCKKVEKITKDKLDKIIEEFIDNPLVKMSNHFLLATSADLQSPVLQNRINYWKKELNDSRSLRFDCWDVNTVEIFLSNHWGFTTTFFGKEAAEKHCYKLNTVFPNLLPVDGYISRKISPLLPDNDDKWWYLNERELIELKDMFLQDRTVNHRVCLLGGAYQGKTSYLKQTAYLLKEAGVQLQPFFIEVKEFNVLPLETLLEKSFGVWKNVPYKDIVIFIDGLDESPTDQFREMVKHIHAFAIAFPQISIVVSCRKLFYQIHEVGTILTSFTFYELFRLEHNDIMCFIESSLPIKREAFLKAVSRNGSHALLDHPFYLENLVKHFKETGKLPKSKIKIVELFIDRTYQAARSRQIAGGKTVKDESRLFKQVIGRFAVALQMAGLNTMSNDDMQELFTTKEIELLQHNSMVYNGKPGWGFTNAMFQEHFAALTLAKTDFETVIYFAAVGTQTKKIKAKWIQTVSSLLSILDEETPFYKELFSFIEQDNIELLFMAEPSKFTIVFREQLLIKLISRISQTQARPILVYEETIGEFINGIDSAIGFLINHLGDKQITDRVKVICARILISVQIPSSYLARLTEVVLKEANRTAEPYYATQLIRILCSGKIGDKKLIDALISGSTLINTHEYRSSLYELITLLGLYDEYYEFALEGFKFLTEHNRTISHSGSERTLEELLLSTTSYKNLRLVFLKMSSKEWIEHYSRNSIRNEGFMHELLQKCTKLFPQYPLLIYPIARFIKMLGRQYLRSEFKEFDHFLDETESAWIAVRILIKEISKDNNWEIGALITPDSFDYLLFEFEESDWNKTFMRNCFSGMRYRNGEEDYQLLFQLCDDALGGELSRERETYKQDAYNIAEKIKRANDRKYFTSKENFKEGIIKYFAAHGKKSITEDEIYIDPEQEISRQKFDSNFLFTHLLNLKRETGRVTLAASLKITEDQDWYDYFRVTAILNQSADRGDDTEFYQTILRNYFEKHIQTANMVNTYRETNSGYQYQYVPELLGRLFSKYKFEASPEKLMELVWLDTGGIRSWEHSITNRFESISQSILEKLNEVEREIFKGKIVANMRLGIKMKSVLGNHISLCRRLKIFDATDDLLYIIQHNLYESHHMFEVIKIYLELNGDIEEVLKIFRSITDYNDYLYKEMISYLLPLYPSVVLESLLKSFNSDSINAEVRIDLARYMSRLGSREGFHYITEQLRRIKKSPYTIQGKIDIHYVDTATALAEMQDLVYFLVDPAYGDHRTLHDSAKNIILEWIFGFAGKSEADMNLVLTFLYDSIPLLQKMGYKEEALDLNFYANRILENFRGSDNTIVPLSIIKSKLKVLD